MAKYITTAQYNVLSNARFIYGLREFNELLEKFIGAQVAEYTAYDYYDASGAYIGNSRKSDVDALLKAAHVEVNDG